MTLKVKRIAFVLLASFGMIFLTGCVKFDLDLVVNKDSTISGTMIFAVSDALASLGETDSSQESDVSDELVDPKTKGVLVEEFKKGGFTGQKITLDRVPFSEFKQGGDSGDLTITREGDLITLNGFLDLAMEDADSSEDLFAAELAKSIFASADFKIRVTFPFEVVSTAGELSEDRRTVTWEPKIGDRVDLKTTVKIPSAIPIVPIAAAIVVLLLVLTLVVLRRKRMSQSKTIAQQMEAVPETE